MKRSDGLKVISAILIIVIMTFGFCSCKTEKETQTTANTNIQTTYFASVITTVTAESSVEAQSGETQSGETQQTDVQTTTAQVDEITLPSELITGITLVPTEGEEVTEPVTASGVLTVTDGNKTIVYPAQLKSSQQTYPVIVWANGTGCPTQSYTGLLEALANGGYIVVADSDVMTADGTSQKNSIDYIIEKNSDESSVFYKKVNTSAIGACGHSQGGRSCVNAAQTDSRIRALVSISGASSAQEANSLKTPSLFLTGTSDLIVVSSQWCQPSYDAVSGRAAYASLKGGIHTTCMTTPKKVSGYALDWFDAYLKNDSTAKSVFEDGGKLSKDEAWQDFQNKN